MLPHHQRGSNFSESWYRFIASERGSHHSLRLMHSHRRSLCFSWDDDLSMFDRIASCYSFTVRAHILANMNTLLFTTHWSRSVFTSRGNITLRARFVPLSLVFKFRNVVRA